MATVTLDLTGLKCPLPVLRTKKAFAALKVGDRLVIHCTDPMAAIDIPHLVATAGHRLIACEHAGHSLTFKIEIESI